MSQDASNQAIAVERLIALGLSTYAARTFVALVALGDGTAQDVSDAADVPRTRVYDAVAELQDNGLVETQQSTPKRFRPVSAETAVGHFLHEYEHHAAVLSDALDDLEPVGRSEQQGGIWTVTGQNTITDRIVEFVDGATDEVVVMAVEELLTEPVLDSLRAASERGVTVRLAGISDTVEADVREAVPDVDVFESIWVWSDTPAGRLLMIDGTKTLVSVLVSDDRSHSTGSRKETAIWGSGETNGLVVVLKAMFTWQLDRSE